MPNTHVLDTSPSYKTTRHSSEMDFSSVQTSIGLERDEMNPRGCLSAVELVITKPSSIIEDKDYWFRDLTIEFAYMNTVYWIAQVNEVILANCGSGSLPLV